MSTRRDSRVHLAARQNDALLEFENFKKKYLLVNKHITKLNSTLSVRIEELNAQISELYVENLRLRASEIALGAQLQREREKTRRLLHDAETAVSICPGCQTASLATRLSTLRDAYNIPPGVEHPKQQTQPPLRAQKPLRSSSSTPPRPARVSRPPDFARIAEDDEDAASSPARDIPERPSSRLEMTFEREQHLNYPMHQPTLAEVDFSHRAPRRRQSGLVTTLMRGDVEDVTTPATFREPKFEADPDTGHEEMDIVDLAPPTPVLRKTRRLSGPTPSPAPLPPDNDDDERERKEKERAERERKEKEREERERERKEKEREERAREKARLRAEREKEKERARLALEEQERQQQQQQQEQQRRPFAELPLNPPTSSTSPPPPKHPLPTKLPQPVERVATPVDESAQPAAEGRGARARKSVNYAEPKLNTKMRKPDPPEGAPAPAPRRKKSSTSGSRRTVAPAVAAVDDAGDFADAEGAQQSAAATYVRRHSIAV